MKPTAKQSPFPLRMPPMMRESIKETAWRNRESMNATIVAMLQAATKKESAQ